MTPLPVLKSSPASSPEQLVRLYHQSQLEWCRHLGDETELDFGRWIPAAGCLLDAQILPGAQASDLIRSMAENCRQGGGEWRRCVLNPSMPKEQTAPLAEALLAAGWVSRPVDILYRNQKTEPIVSPGADLKIIPARASYRHYRGLMEQRAGSNAVESAMLHLDDSHFDVLLALKDGKSVGSVGVLCSGELGTVREWYVTPGQRHNGIGRLLLERAMDICTRAMLRHVMIGLPGSTDAAGRICQSSGFQRIGQQYILANAAEFLHDMD